MSEQAEAISQRQKGTPFTNPSQDLISLLARKVVGQSAATNAIVPYVYMYQSGLAPLGRPAGVFLLLGSEKLLVKIDCGEFQLDHGDINPGSVVRVALATGSERLEISVERGREFRPALRPSILIVDDNHDLLMFLAVELKEVGWEMLTAESAAQARELCFACKPTVVLVDYMLGNDDGLQLALEFQQLHPPPQVIVMTGGGLSDEGLMICAAANVPVLYKPFLASEILSLIRGQFYHARAAVN